MPMFNRGASVRCEPIDQWDDGVGWLAHPHEDATAALRDSLSGARRRVSRALVSNGPTELRVMLRAAL